MKNKHIKLFEDYHDNEEMTSAYSEEDEDLMSDEEVKQEVLEMIQDYKSRANEWSVRDTLKHFTSYGFWSGNQMASLDINGAKDIAQELYDYVNEFPAGHPNIEEVYDDLYKR